MTANTNRQLPSLPIHRLPVVTVKQMRQVDRLMVEEVGVDIIMMMENASINTARLAQRLLGGTLPGKKILVLAGKGNNGGDGLGAARHLINFGAGVTVVLASERRDLGENALVQQQVLDKLGVPIHQANDIDGNQLTKLLAQADLIIDTLLGYNLKGDPRGEYARLIAAANQAGRPTLAVDIPSGLDGDTGQPRTPCITATWTLTLALPKTGLTTASASRHVGRLYLCDLSVPDQVYSQLGIDTHHLFAAGAILEVAGVNQEVEGGAGWSADD
ncbi:MAG: NAD(P)H-hydrate epimerase [Candidatus Pacebacteria bacterium CG10_big_fil_rev_8_21_14_0_10_56_10]|nr:MAG: NAD(P)H-hydrate epimerase [Candidatus Pacebacteria bacterium CG10_big_fil_rev_8_21_14_0_10_56_10]